MANMYHQRSREAKLELMKTHKIWGQEAARLLIHHVQEYMQNELMDLDLTVVVSVFVNVKGQRRTYQEAQTLDDEEEFELFVRGFNIGHPMCDFMYAGAEKECSDEKI
ncbi:hypothetical protein PABG_01122 [Paracoccidioides brasiliensis Pb03]|nr:hypothetical protein PABG_01122 [Paracoccidioides brasiliensis Pb03]